MLDYLVRFAQVHEDFRIAELQALADLNHVRLQIVHYSEYSPFAVIRLPNGGDVAHVTSRAILVQSVYELWGDGKDYESLHASVKSLATEEIPKYKYRSFKFTFDSFQGSKSAVEQRQLINSFAWLGFEGPISLKAAEQSFVIFEEYPRLDGPTNAAREVSQSGETPTKLYFGRMVGTGSRDLPNKYSLKKRHYISTTSMDAEISLVMANMVHAKPGSLIFDPFVGTGGLTISCAHFGAAVFGSDIDPRAIRGKDGLNLKSNFQQYEISGQDLGSFISDLVNTPIRGWTGPLASDSGAHHGEWLDGIVCDPPYGVREGLKTLGRKNDLDKKIHYSADGVASYLNPGYVAPKKQYSFVAILDDLLSFAAAVLMPNGRLSFWMPTADDVEETLQIPKHRKLELVSVCVQPFNNWSRRLITYRKRHSRSCPASPLLSGTRGATEDTGMPDMDTLDAAQPAKIQADDLNPFRRRYFQGWHSSATEQPAKAVLSSENTNEQSQSNLTK